MLIIPAEHPLNWKKPPVITLLLVLLNVLIYFAYQGGDQAREEQAAKLYLDGGLLSRERALFVDSFGHRRELDEAHKKAVAALPRSQLATLVLSDLEFEQRIHHDPAYQADPAWQQARQRAEAARDQISRYRFGFIPAKFSVQGLFGAMFLHADFSHLAGNMLFLFIFGFALEIALGRWLYLGLYLFSGLASHLLWWMLDPAWVTGIGASGAIAGLMGMYLGVYGMRRINFFYWLGPLFGYFRAPALWILPIWMGKELYGLLLAADHVNYYAHLGGMAAGFLAVWLPRQGGRLKVDESYLHKEDPDAPFKRELQGLDQLIGRFALDQVAPRGLDLLQRYPGRIELLDKLYPVAQGRQDKALLTAVLKQLFALPPSPGERALLLRMAQDSNTATPALLLHSGVQAHLLRNLLRASEARAALSVWRRLGQLTTRPTDFAALTLHLAKLLDRQDLTTISELNRLLAHAYPASEQAQHLALYCQHLAARHSVAR
ncbi:rhomboid family intramembrane serine protease [Pseudomonas sp. LS44]|uniref:rhomboid family intramembrane serine protease n=1 Tax=Pseudomonas sp. LS44 TaxID=1357074 RepID=UPI00215A1515|nr:rhomboid family intramembrane serine protease [Pseudomonas sp. LS44]UVE17059.1 rhomboid family intramembrane serine protease [Pseudomonas sp. LS44]